MPNINLRDNRARDALVRADSIGQSATVAYVDGEGAPVRMRKVLKATSEHGMDRLLAAVEGDEAKLAAALVGGDPDCDLERVGMFLTDASRVFVNAKGDIAYQIQQVEIVRSPTGEEKERRPRRQVAPNVDGDIPISWTGKLVPKADAIRRFVFSSKLQIMHVNGLTYDFLYGMAKELASTNSLMLLGAGKSGKEPLIFRRGSTPHRGFLEGRVDGDKYVLLLHLSKMELKRPAVVEVAAVAAMVVAPVAPAPATVAAPAQPAASVVAAMVHPVAAAAAVVSATVVQPTPVVAAPPAAIVPTPPDIGAAPVPPHPATVKASTTRPAAPHKPTAAEVLDATSEAPTVTAPCKGDLTETVAAGKATRQRKKATSLSADASGPDAAEKPATKPRAKRAKTTPAP